MKCNIIRTVTLLLVAGLLVGSAPRIAVAADNPTINLELSDVDARAAIKMLFQSVGRNYAIQPDVEGTIPSVVLRDIPFDQALKSLLKSAGLVHRMDGDVYIISKKPEVTNPAAAPSAAPEVLVEPTVTEETTIEKIPLNNVGASEILAMINGGGSSGSGMGFGSYGNSGMGNFGSSGMSSMGGSGMGNFGSSGMSSMGGSSFGSSNRGSFGSSSGMSGGMGRSW